MLKRLVQENEPLKKIQTELGVAQSRLRELQEAGHDTGNIQAEIVRLTEARRRVSDEIVKRFVQESERLKKIQADLGVAQNRLRELQQAGEYTGDIEAEIARLEAARRILHHTP